MMELRLVGSERPASRPIEGDWSEARSRRQVILRTCVVVLDLAQTWGDEGAAVVVMHPPLTRADVQSAFREVSEKFCVGGIDLCFDEHESGRLRAIFRVQNRSAFEVGEELHGAVARA
jgi:hypothetical protein